MSRWSWKRISQISNHGECNWPELAVKSITAVMLPARLQGSRATVAGYYLGGFVGLLWETILALVLPWNILQWSTPPLRLPSFPLSFKQGQIPMLSTSPTYLPVLLIGQWLSGQVNPVLTSSYLKKHISKCLQTTTGLTASRKKKSSLHHIQRPHSSCNK